MKYIDWVSTVLLGIRDAKAALPTPAIMLSEEALAKHLGVADKERGMEAVGDAIRDLVRLSAVESQNVWDVKLTPMEGKRLAETSLRALWPEAENAWVDKDQREYLTALIEMSEWRSETHACLEDVNEDDLLARLDWETRDDVNVNLLELRNALRASGFIDGHFPLGTSVSRSSLSSQDGSGARGSRWAARGNQPADGRST